MNWGQVLIPLGEGRYAIREDVFPPFSVLALELRRWHASRPRKRIVNLQERRSRLFEWERHPQPLRDRVLEALQVARAKGAKLSTEALCQQLHSSKRSKRVGKALRALCAEGLAEREGNNRTALYWAP